MKNFAAYLKMSRLTMAMKNGGKFTQQDMVDLLNKNGIDVARSTYGNWESGVIKPKNLRIEKIESVIKKHF